MKISEILKDVIRRKQEIQEKDNINDHYEVLKELIKKDNGVIIEIDPEKWQNNWGDGVIEKKENGFIIKIKKYFSKYDPELQPEETKLKKAFVLAHEYGHYKLGHLYNGKLEDTRRFRKKIDFSDSIELEAEAFAYRYFINDEFKEFINDYKIYHKNDIKKLIKKYGLNEEKINFLYEILKNLNVQQ